MSATIRIKSQVRVSGGRSTPLMIEQEDAPRSLMTIGNAVLIKQGTAVATTALQALATQNFPLNSIYFFAVNNGTQNVNLAFVSHNALGSGRPSWFPSFTTVLKPKQTIALKVPNTVYVIRLTTDSGTSEIEYLITKAAQTE